MSITTENDYFKKKKRGHASIYYSELMETGQNSSGIFSTRNNTTSFITAVYVL